ncbi:MAG: adenine phosphoribosyltransferase [Azoarcus sp.]|jgi:adenine phosphoribosyltransferase|nr:adenine phosphoribosyltransferase [Azoarcus sp.]
MPIKSRIRAIPDFPQQGVTFRDITTLLKDATGFRLAIHKLINRYSGKKIHKVAAIESRGFVVGSPLAYALGAGFVPVRKKGKLPFETVGYDYTSEYGTDRIEIHTDAISQGERILLVDDLLATGGTAEAAYKLLHNAGGIVTECAFIVDLPKLGGHERLKNLGLKIFTLTEFAD